MSTSLPFVDRDGVPMCPGQQLEIQYCVGPYGRTQLVKGVLREIDHRYRGVTIELTEATVWRAKDRNIRKDVGDSFYVPLRGEVVDGKFVCMHTHHDFEHGHEAWARVVDSKASPPQERVA